MFGEITAILSAGRMIIFLVLLGVVGFWGYTERGQKQSAQAQLEGVTAKLEACQALSKASEQAKSGARNYREEQNDVVDNYYKTMPKRPQITVDDDADMPGPDVKLRTPTKSPGDLHVPGGKDPRAEATGRSTAPEVATPESGGANSSRWKALRDLLPW